MRCPYGFGFLGFGLVWLLGFALLIFLVCFCVCLFCAYFVADSSILGLKEHLGFWRANFLACRFWRAGF
ncbi:hypothetical protein BKN38_02565 [Helicobacter sp. CLO-3]|nr:hypothetical protein BA723_00470 [Helicobacter sp. CLO-3]OHU84684.1 hypothetical protein BKN38_02565 [Helicobacter sp. CLO-3]